MIVESHKSNEIEVTCKQKRQHEPHNKDWTVNIVQYAQPIGQKWLVNSPWNTHTSIKHLNHAFMNDAKINNETAAKHFTKNQEQTEMVFLLILVRKKNFSASHRIMGITFVYTTEHYSRT